MKTTKIEIVFAPKTVNVNGQYLHFWYANNKGRGENNCTIILSTDNHRAPTSVKQLGVISMVKTSSWAGTVNFSQNVQRDLGL